jgi:hypothetical protein
VHDLLGAALARMAERHGCAVYVVLHLSKRTGTNALHRIGGSVGIPAAARSALVMTRAPDDPDEEGNQRILAQIMTNLGPVAPSLLYEIETVDLPATRDGHEAVETTRLKLLGETEYSGRELPVPKAANATGVAMQASARWNPLGDADVVGAQRCRRS